MVTDKIEKRPWIGTRCGSDVGVCLSYDMDMDMGDDFLFTIETDVFQPVSGIIAGRPPSGAPLSSIAHFARGPVLDCLRTHHVLACWLERCQ